MDFDFDSSLPSPKAVVAELVNELYGEARDNHAQAWYSFEVTRAKTGQDLTEPTELLLLKSWAEIERFHGLVRESDDAQAVRASLPSLPDASATSAAAIGHYFDKLLELESVREGSLLEDFLRSAPEAQTVGDAPVTAIHFLLQPSEPAHEYLARRQSLSKSLPVLRGETVVWQFEVGLYDIEFSVRFEPGPPTVSPLPSVYSPRSPSPARSRSSGSSEPELVAMSTDPSSYARCPSDDSRRPCSDASVAQTVHQPTRYSTAGGRPVQGSFTCPADGTITLTWDNKFSRFRGKTLSYIVESVTPSTMRAAIEAADAVAQKNSVQYRRAASPSAAQSDAASVLAAGSASTGTPESEPPDRKLRIRVFPAEQQSSSSLSAAMAMSPTRGSAGSAAVTPERWDSSGAAASRDGGGRFSVRRTATALLQYAYSWSYYLPSSSSGASASGAAAGAAGSEDAAAADAAGAAAASELKQSAGGSSVGGGEAMAKGIEELVARYEALEDELAVMSARRAQSGAQAKVLLARLHITGVEKQRLERSLAEMEVKLAAAVDAGQEAAAAATAANATVADGQAAIAALEGRLIAAQRERDLLQAERNVWQVARSGIQAELARVAAALELERQAHDDSKRALARSHEAQQRLELENRRLGERLAAQGSEELLEKAKEEARLAREEAEDARSALVEGEAELATLAAHKRVLVSELRAQRRRLGDEAAAARAEAEEARMMQRAMQERLQTLEEERKQHTALQADLEVKLARLRAERRVLVAEVRKAAPGVAGAFGSGSAASAGSIIGSDDGGDADLDQEAFEAGSGGLFGQSQREGGDGVAESSSAAGGGGGGGGSVRHRGSKAEAAALVKLLSRQLVHLRERRQQLREQAEEHDARGSAGSAAAAAARRSEVDLERAIGDLQARIRKLLAAAHEDT